MRNTGFLYDSRFLDHKTGDRFPENSRRLIATMEHLHQQPWFDSLVQIKPRTAEIEWIETIHKRDYIDYAKNVCESDAYQLDDPDVRISKESFDVARLATGGALELVDSLMRGDIDNGFGLLRPPGHHAESNRAMGFCLLNNVAIGAKYLQKQYGIEKVLILDWDVHHGNGTQHSFEEDPSVLFVSLHQYPFYPGTGAYSETGQGRGANATVNCPMSAGSRDTDYEAAFAEKILPAINNFKPQVVLISAGFDAHAADPLGQVQLSTECFAWMTKRMQEVAEQHANGRLIALLEGGYNLEALSHCVATHLECLMNGQ